MGGAAPRETGHRRPRLIEEALAVLPARRRPAPPTLTPPHSSPSPSHSFPLLFAFPFLVDVVVVVAPHLADTMKLSLPPNPVQRRASDNKVMFIGMTGMEWGTLPQPLV